jgi:hypothetical protein
MMSNKSPRDDHLAWGILEVSGDAEPQLLAAFFDHWIANLRLTDLAYAHSRKVLVETIEDFSITDLLPHRLRIDSLSSLGRASGKFGPTLISTSAFSSDLAKLPTGRLPLNEPLATPDESRIAIRGFFLSTPYQTLAQEGQPALTNPTGSNS